jgi:uncharacterized protein (DUF58 family)
MNQMIERDKIAQFGNLELLAKQVVEGFITGLHKSPFHGFSVEFAEHRAYNTGESTRHIDWKLYGRTDKLFTKKYEEETNLRCQIVIDCSSSMHFPLNEEMNKLRFSIYAAASIIELLKRQRDAVGISLFTDKLDLHTETRSTTKHHKILFSELEKHLKNYEQSNRKSTAAIKALHDVAELCHKRSLIIIFSDLLEDAERKDDFFQAIQHLKHNKHEVVLFHVVDKSKEIDLVLENRPYKFVDMESGEEIKLTPSQVQEEYKRLLKEHFDSIRNTSLNYRVDFAEADIKKGYNDILLAYLLKRQKMR